MSAWWGAGFSISVHGRSKRSWTSRLVYSIAFAAGRRRSPAHPMSCGACWARPCPRRSVLGGSPPVLQRSAANSMPSSPCWGAWARGDYRDVSPKALVMVTAAVLYFLAPLDWVPDFILGLGLLDDVAVIGYVLGAVREEIAAFERWRGEQANAAAASPDDDGASSDGDGASAHGNGEPPDVDSTSADAYAVDQPTQDEENDRKHDDR